jgi:hypothetical protein
MVIVEWLMARRIALLPAFLKSWTTESISDFRNWGNLSISQLVFPERILYFLQVGMPY